MALSLGSIARCPARSKSNIVAFLHGFSPRRAETFFPIWALFGTTSAGKRPGLAVFITHWYFAQQVFLERNMSYQLQYSLARIFAGHPLHFCPNSPCCEHT